MTASHTLAAAGAALLAAGSAGPWVKVAFLTKDGLEGDGVITLTLAAVVAVLVIVAGLRGRTPSRLALAACAILALAICFIDILDARDAGIGAIEASVGWGLWLALAGGLVLAVGAVVRTASH